MIDDRDPIDELADAVAEGRGIEWDEAIEHHPDRVEQIENLRHLERLAGHFAGIGGSGPTAADAGSEAGTWGHLRLVAPLASGSFGEVWRAFDPVLQREVALKLRRDDPGGAASAREFISEARRLAKLRHPNILGVHGADIHDGRVGLWSELLDGDTLEDHIAGEPSPGLQGQLDIGRDLARALSAVHAAGLVHGDVKAANIAIEPDGRAVLMDFGAGVDLAVGDGSRASYGSPLSSSPERLEGAPLQPSADIWSLGVLFYRLASGGRYPFEAADINELRSELRKHGDAPVAHRLSDAPRSLRGLIDAMLEPDPDIRPTATEVGERLRNIAHAPVRRRRRLAVALIVCSLAFGATVSTIGFVRARAAAIDAETARLDAEEVSRFLREILWSPRMTHGGRNVLMTEVLSGAEKRVKGSLPRGSAARARILEILGGTSVSLSRFEEAEGLLQRAAAELAEAYSPIHPEAVNARILLAEAIRNQGRPDEAEEMLDELEPLLTEISRDHPVHVWYRINRGLGAHDAGDIDRAEEQLIEALKLAKGPDMDTEAPRFFAEVHLAKVWNEKGKFDRVIEMLEPTTAELVERYGMQHGISLSAANALAISLSSVSRHDEALHHFKLVADTAEEWLGADHEYAFTSRINAINAARDLGQNLEAVEAGTIMVARSTQLYGPEHLITLNIQANLALSLKYLGETVRAERLMTDNAARTRANLGPDHPLSYIAGVNLSELMLDTGHPRRALTEATALRRRMAARLGGEHLFVIAADSIIGASKCAVGDTSAGLRLLEQSLEAQRALGGSEDHQALLTQIRLGSAMVAAGRIDEGRIMLDEAVTLCDASLAAGHPLSKSARAASEAVSEKHR